MSTSSRPQARTDVLSVVDHIHRRLNFRHPPFRFEEFLRAFDSYKVFEVELPQGLDGRMLLTPDGEQKTVYLRKQNPRTRVRFTLAHEVMHAEIHFARKQLDQQAACRTSGRFRDHKRSPLEVEADHGAAALLMPFWMIDRHLPRNASYPYSDEVVRQMARLFLVSEMSMRIQLEQYHAQLAAGERQR